MKTRFKWRAMTLSLALTTAALASTMANAIATENELTNYGDGVQSSQYGEVLFNRGQLEQMLAPIALYPDSLLTHILIASTYPLELVQAHRWQQKYEYLSTKQLMRKADNQDWDPSVKALIAFPNILNQLSSDLDWTQDLGDAFLQDEARVLDSIQSLRHQAYEADNLDNTANLAVRHVNHRIIIEPVRTEVIYVPYYDTRVVYGNWRWHKYPPVYWNIYPGYASLNIGLGHRHNHFYWGSGVQISFNYFFSSFHWSKHHVVVTRHQNSQHYRPRQRIVTSYGAKRWQHRPEHRRGVSYRGQNVKQRYSKPQQLHRNEKKSRAIDVRNNLARQDKARTIHPDKKSSVNKHRSSDKNKAVKQQLKRERVQPVADNNMKKNQPRQPTKHRTQQQKQKQAKPMKSQNRLSEPSTKSRQNSSIQHRQKAQVISHTKHQTSRKKSAPQHRTKER